MTADTTGRLPLPLPRLVKTDEELHAGGTVVYRVYLDGRWVGWVGDGREWRGWRYGTRRWWACWRQDGDTAARWNSDLTHPRRRDATADLIAATTRGTDRSKADRPCSSGVSRLSRVDRNPVSIDPRSRSDRPVV